MAIEFHCEFCGKQVRAQDEHAGKRAKCPSCHQSVYVPTPSDQIEALGIEPLDTKFVAEQSRLIRETRDLQKRLLHERDTGPIEGGGPRHNPPGGGNDIPLPKGDIESLIIEYAQLMAAGNLEAADDLGNEIRKYKQAAETVLQKLTIDEMPHPSLSKIPRPVLMGFFKQLREKR